MVDLHEVVYGLSRKFGPDGFEKAEPYLLKQAATKGPQTLQEMYEKCNALYDFAYQLGLKWHETDNAGEVESKNALEAIRMRFPGLPDSL